MNIHGERKYFCSSSLLQKELYSIELKQFGRPYLKSGTESENIRHPCFAYFQGSFYNNILSVSFSMHHFIH